MTERPSRGTAWTLAIVACGVVGTVAVGVTMSLTRGTSTSGIRIAETATEDYGRRLLLQTSLLIGPDNPDPARRFSGSRLNCSSCHLSAGADPGMLSLVQTDERYPRPSGRDGNVGDLFQRIDGCMTRSMNGRTMPRDSVEMVAMVAYIQSLGQRFNASSASVRKATEPPAFATPDRAADPEAGGEVFRARCALCHGADGLGLFASTKKEHGYVFPPLWGPDSFNNGAGMGRVLTAARFIKARMPLGQPDLTDDEAFDVAAYINVQPRPAMANLDRDYPDRSTKPADNPYGPYVDPFPIEQHTLGPFQPIEAFYKQQQKKAAAQAAR